MGCVMTKRKRSHLGRFSLNSTGFASIITNYPVLKVKISEEDYPYMPKQLKSIAEVRSYLEISHNSFQ